MPKSRTYSSGYYSQGQNIPLTRNNVDFLIKRKVNTNTICNNLLRSRK